MDRDRLTEEEIIRLAANRNPLPDGQQPPEVMLFYMLTGLYSAFYNGTITKEAAAMENGRYSESVNVSGKSTNSSSPYAVSISSGSERDIRSAV